MATKNQHGGHRRRCISLNYSLNCLRPLLLCLLQKVLKVKILKSMLNYVKGGIFCKTITCCFYVHFSMEDKNIWMPHQLNCC